MLTILYWILHPLTAHSVVSKISTQLYWSRSKLICFDQIRKTQPRASTVETQLPVFSKSSNSQDLPFRARRQQHIQFIPTAVQSNFLSGVLLWEMMIVISFPRRRKSSPSDYFTWTKRHQIVQSFTKLNNRIVLTKNNYYEKYHYLNYITKFYDTNNCCDGIIWYKITFHASLKNKFLLYVL